MASIKVNMPDEFLEQLSRLGDRTDDICENVLKAGGEVVLAKVRSNLNSVLSGKSTGELQRSLGLTKPRLNRKGTGHDIKIGFAEPRRGKGTSNAKIATILEYGKHNQPPRPFMKPARSQSRKAAIEAMKSAFDNEVKKL